MWSRCGLATATIACVLTIGVTAADGHRLSGNPKTIRGKLELAKQQVRHDRIALRSLRTQGWLLLTPLPFEEWSHQSWLVEDVRYVKRLETQLRPDVLQIICQVFGSYCGQAQRVALCEGGRPVPSVNARNGQYLGIFQMGSFARATYGHGSDAWAQARAAYRYFVASGRDWSPWECKP